MDNYKYKYKKYKNKYVELSGGTGATKNKKRRNLLVKDKLYFVVKDIKRNILYKQLLSNEYDYKNINILKENPCVKNFNSRNQNTDIEVNNDFIKNIDLIYNLLYFILNKKNNAPTDINININKNNNKYRNIQIYFET
jgi:hypothetical protein